MVAPITARRLVERIRQRIADAGEELWSDTEILETADDILTVLIEKLQQQGRYHGIGRWDFATSQATVIENNFLEIEMPWYVQDIIRVEAVSGGNRIELSEADIGNSDAAQSGRIRPRWMRSKETRLLGLFGPLQGGPNIRVWFARAYPPLNYGRTATTNSATMQLDTSAAPPGGSRVGRVMAIDDAYNGLQIQIDSGSNQDVVRRIVDYDGATKTVTFDSALPAATANGDSYSFVVPLEYGHYRFFIEKLVQELVLRLGNDSYAAMQLPLLTMLESEFELSAASQDRASPKKVWSHRR